MPLSAEREGTWVWLLSVGVGLLPLILRLCGNYVDLDHDAGLRELWNVDAFAKDLLLLCIVTCGLGLISLLSKHEILVHVLAPRVPFDSLPFISCLALFSCSYSVPFSTGRRRQGTPM